ncbi:MAG TPA: hypothetical protein VGM90_00270 [Kofleriaceae bacterium]
MEAIEDRLRLIEARLAQLEVPRTRVLVPRAAERADELEATLGAYWLSRIGILSLITGAALLIITYFAQLGPFVRVGVGYAMAGVLAWIGLRLARSHETLGRIVFGGGLAIAYFVTYALHFVASLRVIDSEPLGVVLVAIVIAGIVATAHRMKSETVAGIALFLALHTGTLSEVTALSLIATTLLAAGAAFFLSFNRWVLVPLSTVVAVYSTHAVLAFGAVAVNPDIRIAFVGIDFALFAVAALIGPALAPKPLALLSLLNWAGALVLGAVALMDISPAAAFGGGCLFAVVLAAMAGVARWRGAASELVALHLGLALITLAIVMPLEADGLPLVAAWLAIALAAMVASRKADPRFGVLALLLVVIASRVDDSAIALIACVLTAFAIERWHVLDNALSRLRVIAVASVALGLLDLATTMMPSGLHTLGWVGAAVMLFVVGFALRVASYRWAAFAVLVAAAIRLGSHELRYFTANQRILTFVGAGVAMLVVSFVYNRRAQRR